MHKSDVHKTIVFGIGDIAMKNVAIYARVSTVDQNVDMQVQQLKGIADKSDWKVTQTIIEKKSGSKSRSDRKGLDELLTAVTKREVDVVMVWSVDRLGRSLTDLVNTMETIKGAGANLYIHSQGIDTNTPTGKAMFGMVSVFAEFERSMIQERVKAGLATAKEKGIQLGRPTLKEKLVERIKAELIRGNSVSEVQKITKASRGTVSRIRQRLNEDGELPKVRGTTIEKALSFDLKDVDPKALQKAVRNSITIKKRPSPRRSKVA